MSWAKIIAKYPEANFLQSPAYGKMNRLLGLKVIEEDLSSFGDLGRALMIVREAKRGRYLEIPCGPLINWGDIEVVRKTMERIEEVARAEKCVFVRIRPQLTASRENLAKLEKLGLRKSPMHLAAEHTVMIDLNKTEEELLANMRRQTRYEVRRADKFKITVTRDNSEEIFREFHAVQVETAKRQGFVPPDLKTLLAEREAFSKNAWIYVARTEMDAEVSGEDAGAIIEARKKTPKSQAAAPIAYGLIIADGKEGDYYEAASTDLNRKIPGAYALLWQVMRDLKKAGYERFNLWGIAPANQPNHRYAKVTTFKTGFGGEIIEYIPAHDLVISKTRYLKNLAVETMRKKRRHL